MVEDRIKENNVQMYSQSKAYLDEWVAHYQSYSPNGQTPNYIPALRTINSSHLGICIIVPDGTMIKSGDCEVSFTLQSISKVISFIAACLSRGIPYVLERVDVEPTGDAFNSIIRLEMHKPGKPFNPMINAGAITIASLLPGESSQNKLEFLYVFIEKMIGKRPTINEEVFRSEWQTAHRNRALAYYLKETGFLESEVEESLEVYLKLCSIEVNTEDIALIGLILAHDGYHPIRKEQVLPKNVAKLAKALMLTCGMYNASGKFAAFVGLPAKSGVSGGIMALVPSSVRKDLPFQTGCGIGIYGPAIDDYGNSLTGVLLLKHIAQEWDLSIF
ncbi:glutaminase [Bacillus sp. CMF21]|jgi:glutaminase|uniref:glutaminase n=1 Tax=Metabacillus dongyingensis TaxID=2874282 RepID=UPI001CC01BCE|nr:glutaminase [Metabacillus dongyingensis]UAL52659.1 glutaminase [Metabacillus dongyingensis]USK28976.1 glutaminase [Bacillus sp. CMF21]